MMNRRMIIEELNNRGYKAEEQNNIKNGVLFEGIRFVTESNVAPVIYTEEIISRAEESGMSFDEVVTTIISLYESNKALSFDVNQLFDRDFIMSHIYIGLQKESAEELLKKESEFEGIEQYLYLRGDTAQKDSYSIKLNEAILEKAEISEAEAWDKAEENTNAETTIKSMAMLMAEMLGMEYSEEMEEMTPCYVITNESKVKGASAVLNKEVLAQFGRKHGTEKIVVLPSSIHEMLLIPYTEEMSLDDFSAMVGDVNGNHVAPEERLTDRAYIVTL